MSISDSTIYTDVFTDIRTALVAASLTTTNTTTSATATASVLGSFNDKAPTRPQVVITGPEKDMSRFKFGSARGREFINVTIDCYADALGSSQLANQVEDTILDTSWDGMEVIAVSSTQGFVTVNEAKYHIKSLTFTFDRE